MEAESEEETPEDRADVKGKEPTKERTKVGRVVEATARQSSDLTKTGT